MEERKCFKSAEHAYGDFRSKIPSVSMSVKQFTYRKVGYGRNDWLDPIIEREL